MSDRFHLYRCATLFLGITAFSLMGVAACDPTERLTFSHSIEKDRTVFTQTSANYFEVHFRHARTEAELNIELTGTGYLEKYNQTRSYQINETLGETVTGYWNIMLERVSGTDLRTDVNYDFSVEFEHESRNYTFQRKRGLVADFTQGDWKAFMRGEYIELEFTEGAQDWYGKFQQQFFRAIMKPEYRETERTLPPEYVLGLISFGPYQTKELGKRMKITGTIDQLVFEGPKADAEMFFEIELMEKN